MINILIMAPISKAPIYKRLSMVEHLLKRSDMWVGSTEPAIKDEFVAEKNGDVWKIISKSIRFPPALLRTFVEALSNAVDNVERSRKGETKCSKIEINIDKETGLTSVKNDGEVVSIEMHPSEGCYNHTLIFGHLLTGSNYEDEAREISGKNGIGIKATNVFATTFTVKGIDPKIGLSFEQTWTENMTKTSGPKVKSCKRAKGITEVSWIPDFPKFKMTRYTDDIISLYTRYIIDAAMLTKVKIYLNGDLIVVSKLSQYALMYGASEEENLCIKTGTSEVVVTPASEYRIISFVNGIYTRGGGRHVDAWTEALFRPIVEKMNKKTGKPSISIRDVKQVFQLFVVSTVINPVFNGQDKERLEAPDVPVEVKPSYISKMCKWSVYEQLESLVKGKELSVLKKAETRSKFIKVEGLDQANKSGGKLSSECSLILCEGLSAKTYAVKGIQHGLYGKTGRDWFGIYALRGKLLNTLNASPTQIASNKVITELIQAIGLKYGEDYADDNSYKKLRYGRIILLCDGDKDGIHIEGLIANFLYSLFPSLLKRPTPYLISMKTPIVRVFKPKADLLFFDEENFKLFVKTQGKTFKKKYYKGLGTTKDSGIQETFGKKMVEYTYDENSEQTFIKAFSKTHAHERKDWIGNFKYDPATSIDKGADIMSMSFTTFLDNELVKFSIEDCERNLPNWIDGFKTSQRKIIYAVKKRKLSYASDSLKVAQLGGYVAEHTNYHHGEQNLYETIIGMSTCFVGANNCPLLYRDGQFGSREYGGKDSASPRYIYTKMEKLTELIFRPEDDPLLTYVMDDGDFVEPAYYVPIIPMILINGSVGIGTGWSTDIPSFNPIDIIDCIRKWIKNDRSVWKSTTEQDEEVKYSVLPDIKPWYLGFTGEIERKTDSMFLTKGIMTSSGKTKTITELPIGLWTNNFKTMLEEKLINGDITNLNNQSSPDSVFFTIIESKDKKLTDKDLSLTTTISLSNMVGWSADHRITKHTSIETIIDQFCQVRYDYYIKRREYLLGVNKERELIRNNKIRFMREVISKTIPIMDVPKAQVEEMLENREYQKIDNGYGYLLNIRVYEFVKECVDELEVELEGIRRVITELTCTKPDDIWLKELQELETEYGLFQKNPSGEKTRKNKK